MFFIKRKIDLLTPVSDYISSFKNMKVNTKDGDMDLIQILWEQSLNWYLVKH